VGQNAGAPLEHTISVSRGPAPDTLPSGAVMVRDIAFRSMCEHHLLPFRGRAHVAYLPGEEVVGLGALPRVIDVLAARPQVQERLGEQIADEIDAALDARGVLVVLDAVHECVTIRGGRQPDASTVTIAARGAYTEPAARAELIALIGTRP
jgi:GTP cyclohydrolase I